MLRVLMRWFPDRRFVCTGDGNYATHELAELAAAPSRAADPRQPVLPRANLFEPPPPYSGQRPAAGQGGETAQPGRGGRDATERAGAGGRLVRRGPAPRRGGQRRRPLVQGRPAAGRRCVGSSSMT